MSVSRPVQIVPPGLLGFLQLKNNGVNPTDFPDVLQPVFELRDWYLTARSQEHPAVGIGITAVGFVAFSPTVLTVPDREFWHINDLTLEAITGVGEALNVSLAYRILIGGVAHYHQITGNVSIAASNRILASGSGMGTPARFIPPGAVFGAYVNSFTGNPTVNGFMRYTPLPI